jgi:hypothetical protein
MNTYQVLTARKHYHEFNEVLGTFTSAATDIKYIRDKVKRDFNINPYYAVIIDITDGAKIILNNEFLQVCIK